MTTQRKPDTVKKPTHRIFAVTGKDKQATWTPIGAAWPNRDGAGFSMQLDAVPIAGGRIVMREISAQSSHRD